MSDLSVSLEALARSRTQLPVASYFDAALFRREQELIFQPGPRYVGHELAVPERRRPPTPCRRRARAARWCARATAWS